MPEYTTQSIPSLKDVKNYADCVHLFKQGLYTICMKTTILMLAIVASITMISVVSATTNDAIAQPHYPLVTLTPVNDEISIQQTQVVLSVSPDNLLPWGYVTGYASSNYVPDHPVVIQFHQNGELVHVAQVDLNDDGSYEYMFRVLSVDHNTGQTTHIFQGEYIVSMYKMVPNTASSIGSNAETI